jgi:hypothetical protein
MGDDARRTIGVGGTMRLLLATTLTLASVIASSAQTPTRISEVAKLVEMRTFRGETYPIFNYQGVFVQGDVSLKDYNDTTAVVRQELRVGEEIIEVIASQQVSLYRQYGKDLIVRTCVGPCGKGKEQNCRTEGQSSSTVVTRVGNLYSSRQGPHYRCRRKLSGSTSGGKPQQWPLAASHRRTLLAVTDALLRQVLDELRLIRQVLERRFTATRFKMMCEC